MGQEEDFEDLISTIEKESVNTDALKQSPVIRGKKQKQIQLNGMNIETGLESFTNLKNDTKKLTAITDTAQTGRESRNHTTINNSIR